jgi:outer membrane receptor protein involved in Fe transport
VLPQFSASIDYFHIKIEDGIGTLPAGVILNGCPTSGDAVFCSQLLRQPVTFGLNGASVENGGYIVQTNQNIAEQIFSGIDIQLGYGLELATLGSVNFELAGSYMLKNEITDYPGSTSYDCTGLFGLTCQTVNPEWRHVLRTTWNMPWNASAALTWRYMDPVKQDNNQSNPVLQNSSFAGFDSFNNRIPSYSYFDVAATYNPLENVELRAGISNLFDNDPPLVSSEIISGGAANTYETYDLFGRQIFLGFTVKL